jgi:hypothetical protein
MINFHLHSFWVAMHTISAEINNAEKMASRIQMVDKDYHARITASLKHCIDKTVSRLNLLRADLSAIALQDLLDKYDRSPYTYADLHSVLTRLHKDIVIDIMQDYFYHYPRDMAQKLNALGKEWRGTLSAFKSARREIESGTDCLALGDYSGCVFHMVRIGELGLRAIAKERQVTGIRNKPLSYATWGDVFSAIEDKLTIIRKKPAGEARDEALKFYNTALSDLCRLQGLRNETMHYREGYDEGDAITAMYRTNELMETLSTKINEDNVEEIPWKL